MNKINYNSLKKVLSLKDMKNILGGSDGSGTPANCSRCPDDCHLCQCKHTYGVWYQCGTGDYIAKGACVQKDDETGGEYFRCD